MKALLFAAIACVGMAFVGTDSASAGGIRFSFGGGHHGRHGHFGHGHHRWGGGWRGHYDWHDTSHFDYHPGGFYRHRNHYHYVPGHYDWHPSGHWDYHHRGHFHHY